MIKKFIADEEAATAIEYGLIAALIGVAAIVGFMVLGNSLADMYGSNSEAVGDVVDDAIN